MTFKNTVKANREPPASVLVLALLPSSCVSLHCFQLCLCFSISGTPSAHTLSKALEHISSRSHLVIGTLRSPFILLSLSLLAHSSSPTAFSPRHFIFLAQLRSFLGALTFLVLN